MGPEDLVHADGHAGQRGRRVVNYLNLILVLLRIVNAIVGWAKEQELLSTGEDRAIARSLAQVAARVAVAKKTKEEVDALSDQEVDSMLRNLEPPPLVQHDGAAGTKTPGS